VFVTGEETSHCPATGAAEAQLLATNDLGAQRWALWARGWGPAGSGDAASRQEEATLRNFRTVDRPGPEVPYPSHRPKTPGGKRWWSAFVKSVQGGAAPCAR